VIIDNMKKQLFEYCVLFHKPIKTESTSAVTEVETEMIIAPKTGLAKNEKDMVFKITREIDKEYAEDPDNIEIIVRPF
jgi:hypothetical protein